MNILYLSLYLFIFFDFAFAGRLLKRWQYTNFDPSTVTDFDTSYNWVIQKYKLGSDIGVVVGSPPHYVVMAQAFDKNGNPISFVKDGILDSTYKGFVYSFELLPAAKGNGIITRVGGYTKVSPSWKAKDSPLQLKNWSPKQLVTKFGDISDTNFDSDTPYHLRGSAFTDGVNCLDFTNVFIAGLKDAGATV
jgi:hypothetical protein